MLLSLQLAKSFIGSTNLYHGIAVDTEVTFLVACILFHGVACRAQLVEIYQSSKSNISEHLTNIFPDKELDKEVVVRKFRTTTPHGAIEGKTQTHTVLHYNLDVIIALGYRVQSPIAVRFRRWATRLLREFIQKGFTMDDERLRRWGLVLVSYYYRACKSRLQGRRLYRVS